MPKIRGSISVSSAAVRRARRAQTRLAGQVALRLAQKQVENIQKRLDQGLNVDDAPMPPYSESYKATRRAHGRQDRRRDLKLTDRMRRSIKAVQTGPTSAQVEVGSSEREKAQKNQDRDEWLGVSPKDQAELDRELQSIQQELRSKR